MGRRRSSFSRRSSTRRRNTATRAPSKGKPAKKSSGFFGNLMGTMFQGMAFGAGSEVAHNFLGNLMGRGSHQEQAQEQQAQPQQQQNQCQTENSNFVDCLKFNSNQIDLCQGYLDALKSCEKK